MAKGAGVAPGTVYTYFGGKEQLVATLYAQRLERFNVDVRRIGLGARGAEELLTSIAAGYMEMYEVYGRDLNVWSGVLVEGGFPAEVSGPLMAVARDAFDVVTGTLEDHIAGPGARWPDAHRRLACPLMWSVLQGLADQFTSARHHVHGAGREEVVALAASTLVAGMRTWPVKPRDALDDRSRDPSAAPPPSAK